MRWNVILSVIVVQSVALVSGFGQVQFHRMAEITALPDRTISLELAGSAPSQFRSYFDLYVLEASSNATDWTPLATLLRTNNSSSKLLYVDSAVANQRLRFYRTQTNHVLTPFPKPTGPYAVGTISVLLTDPSRTNRYDAETNSSFMMTLWYPSRPTPGTPFTPYIESKLAPPLAGLYGTSQNVLASFCSHARPMASVARDEAPYPVVIYSHGFKVDRRDNTARCEELASHGYVAVAVDHADCLATVFPDDELLTTKVSSLSDSLFESNLMDIQIVLKALTRLNEADPLFRESLDLQHIGTMGWSYGGGVAAEICRSDDRVKATVLLDAYLQNARSVAWLGVQKPLLGLYNASSAFTTVFDQTAHDAYWMRIKNTTHQHFADWRAWISSPTAVGRQAAIAMNGCTLSFFNKYLKNQDDHLLDNPAKVYSEVADFMKK